ncbi:MAG: PH domain-containing protein [Bryobacteraceae bacterium]
MQLRPSLKFVKLSYVFCLILAVAIGVYLLVDKTQPELVWTLVVPGFLLVVTAIRHIERRLIKLEILGDHLRYEAGFISKSTRTVDLAKVQDVRVDQTLGQRLVGIGDLSLETSGQGSRIVIRSIDNPQEAADHILGLARAQRAKPDSPTLGPPGAGHAGV